MKTPEQMTIAEYIYFLWDAKIVPSFEKRLELLELYIDSRLGEFPSLPHRSFEVIGENLYEYDGHSARRVLICDARTFQFSVFYSGAITLHNPSTESGYDFIADNSVMKKLRGILLENAEDIHVFLGRLYFKYHRE